MDLRPYVETIHHQLIVAAEAGGDEARAVAERLTAAVDSTVRLALQDALVAAAEEITCELAPGSVELRLRGRDPEFVVRQPEGFGGEPPAARHDEGTAEGRAAVTPTDAAFDADEGGMARVNLRMPDQLKARAEQAAANERMSLNAWLVKAVAAALERAGPPSTTAASRPRAAVMSGGHASASRRLPTSQNKPSSQGGHMPTFGTPAPISVSLDIGAGSVEIIASDRADTVVEVRPSNPAKKIDVGAAEQTRVSYSDSTLTVKAPKNWRQYVVWSECGSVDVKIELPSGSQLRGEAGLGELRVIGPSRAALVRVGGLLGECTFKVGAGDIQVSQAGPLQLRTGVGDITVERAIGHSEITTGSGAVHVSRTEGSAVIKNSNGDIWVGEAAADLRATTANGRISVALARSDVEAKTANGSVQIDEVMDGTVRAHTAMGKVEVGVRRGVAALLDLETSWGKVLNGLDASGAPQPGQPSVEVRARTGFGDIRVFRANGPEFVESPATTGTANHG